LTREARLPLTWDILALRGTDGADDRLYPALAGDDKLAIRLGRHEERLRRHLDEQLGLGPEAQTRALYRAAFGPR
jgi:hypothetical protein